MSHYGLTYTDIVNSFSQALLTDFAVGAVTGDAIITAEIEFQYHMLNSMLSEKALAMLNEVKGEVVSVDASGGFNPSLYADSDIKAYVTAKGFVPCPNANYSDPNTMCWQTISNQIAVTAANISAAGSNHYVLLDAFDPATEQLALYYSVDSTNVTLASLKSCLRSMVCCSLGSRIYPAADADTWSVVSYYCGESTKMQEYFLNGGLPAELKSIRTLNRTIGIGSYKLVRS